METDIVVEKAEKSFQRFQELEEKLSKPDAYQSPDFKDIVKEHNYLKKLKEPWLRYQETRKQLEEAEKILSQNDPDPELKELAEMEKPEAEGKLEKTLEEIKDFLVSSEEEERDCLIMEIRAGTGGDEATLFVSDLFRMYTRFAERKNWKVEIMDQADTEIGGAREITARINGKESYRLLQSEGGGHRVQRVPVTETSGRIHTSAATVAILPEIQEMELKINPEDLKIEVQRASGAGGQHVNKTESAVRITHVPTGIMVYCQTERSQHKNRANGMRVLRSRLYEHYQNQRDKKRSSQRKNQIGSGDRSQRIRTYNFPQNRVTDHRMNQNYSLEKIIDGDIQNMLSDLAEYRKLERLKEL